LYYPICPSIIFLFYEVIHFSFKFHAVHFFKEFIDQLIAQDCAWVIDRLKKISSEIMVHREGSVGSVVSVLSLIYRTALVSAA